MLPMARFLDIGVGICFHKKIPHPATGIIITKQFKVLADMRPIATQIDLVVAPCSGVGVLMSFFPTILAVGFPICHLVSPFVGVFNGIIVTSSAKVM